MRVSIANRLSTEKLNRQGRKKKAAQLSLRLFNQAETLCCSQGGSISPDHIAIAHAAFLISSEWTTAVSSLEDRKLSAKRDVW